MSDAERVVLCFGDSNTHGTMPLPSLTERGRHGFSSRWTGHFRRALGPAVHVIDEGHPGRTTVHPDPVEGEHRNGLSVLLALLESHRPLDLVVMMLGTNDCKARFAVTADDIARSIDRLCGVIAAAQCGPGGATPKLLLVAPPPLTETGCLAGMFEGGAAKAAALAPRIEAVAQARGAGFVDAGAHITVSPIDGVHFDAAAHATLGTVLARAAAELLD
ncbi:GDSL-type esterase/lipase family protein [Acidimangrovimonas pyrenivorans]|uniref:GDSL-type esterase/lipase family protein n=1 Tax=Acidimangrovimonas pyrenivorans TaxID=2030798 RepID=A0ABV7AG78_9RHOB